MSAPVCNYCGNSSKLVTGREVYPHRPDLFSLPIWACMPCGAWVGCHPGSDNSLGRLANASSRRLKMAAHAAFDPLWKSGNLKRKDAYYWLSKQLGVPFGECHMGSMSDDVLRRVPGICAERGQG